MTDKLDSVMAGQGYYNQHSSTQAQAASVAFPFLQAAAREVPLPEGKEIFRIADLGSAQGRNSLMPLQMVINILRERRANSFPVQITHTDQPGNDFASLFQLLETSPDSYLNCFRDTYAAASGRSFYKRIFPAASINFMWSSIALHWMSRIPAVLPKQIWSNFAKGPVLEAFRAQAKEDWRNFLTHRAAELKPGGRLVIAAGASDDKFYSGGEPLFALANQVLEEMVAKNSLTREEYEAFTIPVYSRTLAEFLEPLQVEPFNKLFQVEGARVDATPDFQCETYQRDKNAKVFAQNLAGFFRGFTETLFLAALNPIRSAEQKQEMARLFYGRVQEEVLANPEKVQFYWNVASIFLHLN